MTSPATMIMMYPADKDDNDGDAKANPLGINTCSKIVIPTRSPLIKTSARACSFTFNNQVTAHVCVCVCVIR